MIDLEELKLLKESEDNVEFKEAKNGTFSYGGGAKSDPKDRRKCILGYIVALANEGGGMLVFGMTDKPPRQVVGTSQNEGAKGELEQRIYSDLGMRVNTYELYDEQRRRVFIISVPPRKAGEPLKFEEVPLMRVGDQLLAMDMDQMRKIIFETEPDFFAAFCRGLTLDDLDAEAIRIMKRAYSRKNLGRVEEQSIGSAIPLVKVMS